MLKFIIGLFIGGIVGFITFALLSVASKTDDMQEEYINCSRRK